MISINKLVCCRHCRVSAGTYKLPLQFADPLEAIVMIYRQCQPSHHYNAQLALIIFKIYLILPHYMSRQIFYEVYLYPFNNFECFQNTQFSKVIIRYIISDSFQFHIPDSTEQIFAICGHWATQQVMGHI